MRREGKLKTSTGKASRRFEDRSRNEREGQQDEVEDRGSSVESRLFDKLRVVSEESVASCGGRVKREL